MVRRSRLSLLQKAQGSVSVMLLHTEQYVTRSLTSRSASMRRSVSSRGVFSRWNASRCALFGPMPGRRTSSSMRRVRGSGSANLHSRQLHARRQHSAHLARRLFVGLAMGVVQGGDDEILQHHDVLFRDDLGIDRDRLHLLRAVHADGDHAAARVAFDAGGRHVLLQALLHLLRLLHHVLDVHISSTSRISAGKTSSIVWTPASASACSRSADFLSPRPPPGASPPFAAASPAAPPSAWMPDTVMRRP